MKMLISLFLLIFGLNTYASNSIEQLEEAFKKEPDNIFVIHELANIYHHKALRKEKGALEKAERFLKEAHKRFPTDAIILAWYGSLLTIKARDSWFPLLRLYYLRQGIAMLDDAVKAKGDNIIVRMIRANNALHLPEFTRRIDIAIEDFEYILNILKEKEVSNKILSEIHLCLAKAYTKKGDNERARKHFEKVIEFATKDSEEYKEAASFLKKLITE